MRSLPKIGAIGASLALAAAAAGFAMSPAGAAGNDFSSSLTGALNLNTPATGASSLPLTGMVSGSFDQSSGDLTGNVSISNGTTTVNVPNIGAVELAYQFAETGGITGGTVGSDGAVSFSDTQTMTLTSVTVGGNTLPLPATCAFGPLPLNFTGTYASATGAVQVTSQTLDVPVPKAADCGDIGTLLVQQLQGATASATASFNIGAKGGPPPTETPSSTTTSMPSTTVPSGPQTMIDAENATSKGCVLTVPIDFAAGGSYTLQVTTDAGKVIGSTTFNRPTAGRADIDVNIDPNHGTQHGDNLNITLTNAQGTVVDKAIGQVDDPAACAPNTPANPSTPMVTPTNAQPATAVGVQPAYTG